MYSSRDGKQTPEVMSSMSCVAEASGKQANHINQFVFLNRWRMKALARLENLVFRTLTHARTHTRVHTHTARYNHFSLN